jgi:hypothetical protein
MLVDVLTMSLHLSVPHMEMSFAVLFHLSNSKNIKVFVSVQLLQQHIQHHSACAVFMLQMHMKNQQLWYHCYNMVLVVYQ